MFSVEGKHGSKGLIGGQMTLFYSSWALATVSWALLLSSWVVTMLVSEKRNGVVALCFSFATLDH